MGKKFKPWKKSLTENPFTKMTYQSLMTIIINKCDTSILYLGVWWQ
jgi:hypothetical protein